MRRVLTRSYPPLYHVAEGTVHPGPHPDLRGDCTHLRGDCSRLRGDCSGLWGDCTGLRGDCSGLWGDGTDLSGDLDAAGLTEADRQRGVLVTVLIGNDPSHTED